MSENFAGNNPMKNKLGTDGKSKSTFLEVGSEEDDLPPPDIEAQIELGERKNIVAKPPKPAKPSNTTPAKPLPRKKQSEETKEQNEETRPLTPPQEVINDSTANTNSVKRDRKVASVKLSRSPSRNDKPGENSPVSPGKGQIEHKKLNKEDNKDKSSRFVGMNLIQYGLWAHFLAYGAAMMCLCMGIFSMAWTEAYTYECKIDGDFINSKFLYTNNNGVLTCPTQFTTDGVTKDICCSINSKTGLKGYFQIGLAYVIYSVFIILYENTTWGYGLYFPNDTFLYRNKISFIGLLHFSVGVIGLYNYATCLAGGFLVTTGLVYCYAAMRHEAGDGGREKLRIAKEQDKKKQAEKEVKTLYTQCCETFMWLISFNPITFFKRIYNEDKLSSYVWVFLFIAANVILFLWTLTYWIGLVTTIKEQLKDGTLDVYCGTRLCHTNRKMVRYGPFSIFAAFAKGCGNCLNMNSALLLLPIIKMILRKLNNSGTSFHHAQQKTDWFSRFFAHPMTRYIPLSKNIEFHKLCAGSIFLFGWGHIVFHLINLISANNATLQFFRLWGWNGTSYCTGAIATYAMYIIMSAAPDIVRMTKFEIFFNSHHFFIVYYLIMFLHGPNFFYWTALPVLLYIAERYMQQYRGNRPYVVVKVEWIPPVMAVYFRPVFKEDFPFKEGQYLYLNCPHISTTEWHPFTISSAYDDLNNGPRIHLETGEEVVEIPRPKNLPSNVKWNKYCLASKDWTTMDPNEYLEKSETGYNDFVSVHIKVHGLEEPHARTWTRKLKEYFELMSPGKKFPFYFSKRDPRGDILIGRQNGPDGLQILRVDGPHSAPSEHYTNYGTVMLIGAGIGLTPCASILCALTKYRWKKNFNPELVHFYWIVRQNEVDSFQWLVHMLTELSYELKKGKSNNQIERRYYCEINIYVTAVDKKPKEVSPLYRPKKTLNSNSNNHVAPSFTADELYAKMLNPTVDSRGQVKKMKEAATSSSHTAENRLQDIWIWNGRPHWDEIFKEMKEQRQHSDIGVCFCGAPVIGADLKSMCEKYSNAEEDCIFSLHKENF